MKKRAFALTAALLLLFLLSSCGAQKSGAAVLEKGAGPITVSAAEKNKALTSKGNSAQKGSADTDSP